MRQVGASIVTVSFMTACGSETTPAESSPDHWPLMYSARVDGDGEMFVAHGLDTTRLTTADRSDNWGRWSPDGKRIVFQSQRDENYELYVMNADGSDQQNLSNHPLHDGLGVWSPDGRQIAFFSAREADTSIKPFPGHIHTMNADGSDIRRLTERELTSTLGPSSWSPDGSRLLMAREVNGSIDLFALHTDGSGETRLTRAATAEYSGAYSPDGRWIAFHAETDSGAALAIMPADGPWDGTTLPLPPAYYYGPSWSPDGEWLVATRWQVNSSDAIAVRKDGSELRVIGPTGVQVRDPRLRP